MPMVKKSISVTDQQDSWIKAQIKSGHYGIATGRSMGEYRLSQSAKEDLIAIAQYGDEHFGVSQSNQYRDQLKLRFSVLAPWRSPFGHTACVQIGNPADSSGAGTGFSKKFRQRGQFWRSELSGARLV